MAEKTGTYYFTPADVAKEFRYNLLKFADISRWIVSRLHPQGVKCPGCSTPVTDQARLDRLQDLEQIRCAEPSCHRKFTALSGTFLNGSKLEAREVFLLALLLSLGVPARRIADQLRIDVATVRTWETKFQAIEEVASA